MTCVDYTASLVSLAWLHLAECSVAVVIGCSLLALAWRRYEATGDDDGVVVTFAGTGVLIVTFAILPLLFALDELVAPDEAAMYDLPCRAISTVTKE